MNEQLEELMSLKWPVARSSRGQRSAVTASCLNQVKKKELFLKYLTQVVLQ